MGWQKIIYSCGHTDEQQMYGKHADREAKAQQLGQYECQACRAESAAKNDADKGLPQLVGSEKQQTWGSEIRSKLINQLNDLPKEIQARIAGGDEWATKTGQLYIDNIDRIVNYYAAQTDASWWIDNRHSTPYELCKYAMSILRATVVLFHK